MITDEATRYRFKAIGRHVRYVHSGSENSLKAFMWYDGETYESRTFRFYAKFFRGFKRVENKLAAVFRKRGGNSRGM